MPDHLDGVLYIDQLTGRENFWSEEEFDAMLAESEEELEEACFFRRRRIGYNRTTPSV